MTEPTQAKIGPDESWFDFAKRLEAENAELRTALTAAAQVDKPKDTGRYTTTASCYMTQEEIDKETALINAAAQVGEANKCKYPNCDGGPMSGYCHIECRADLIKREWSAGYCEGVAATIERCAEWLEANDHPVLAENMRIALKGKPTEEPDLPAAIEYETGD